MFSVVMLVLALGPQPPAAPPDTPGTVALLATRPSSETATALRSAIVSPQPDVRAVAARVVAVTSYFALVQSVFDALRVEQHPIAAAEQVRTMLLLRGAAAMSLVEPHAARVGGAAVRVVSQWRARQETTPEGTVQLEAGTMWTVEPWLPGLLASTAAAAGCPASGHLLMGFARATYRADGRPLKIELDPHELPKNCHVVLDAMARLDLLEGRTSVDAQPQLLLMPMSKNYLVCTTVQDPPSVLERGVSATGSITNPVKRKDVRPRYPDDLIRSLIQGTVLVLGRITSTGCINTVRILKGVHPVLDVEAARAALQWEFSPRLLDGAPVPVHMTLTVKFSLR